MSKESGPPTTEVVNTDDLVLLATMVTIMLLAMKDLPSLRDLLSISLVRLQTTRRKLKLLISSGDEDVIPQP